MRASELAKYNIEKVYMAGRNYRTATTEIRKDLKKRIRARDENWNSSTYWQNYRKTVAQERKKVYNTLSTKRGKKEFDKEYSLLMTKRAAIDKLYNIL